MTFAANALKAFAAAAYLLNGKVVEAEHWNTATAATALSEWSRARSLWAACGVRVPKGTGPIEDDYGLSVVRLHRWLAGETEYARSVDPVRARILTVALPESGHRFGDIVPHDGAPTGFRVDDDRSKVAVLNELERSTPSAFQTDVVFLSCVRRDDLQARLDLIAPGLGYAQD